MSIVALILCIFFVFWLLRMEHKENPSAPWTLWIPAIWMMKIASSDLAYWLGRGDADPGSGSPYERYLLLLLLCLGLIILYRRRLDWYKAIKDNTWMIALIVFMFVSMIWTEVPFMSLKRWVRELIAVVMALVIFSEDDPKLAAEKALRRSIYFLIPFSFFLVVFFPEKGIRPFGSEVAWIGITNHKNSLGILCYIAVFFLIWSCVSVSKKRYPMPARSKLYADIFVLGMAIYLLKGPGTGKAMSIASVITVIFGLAALFGLFFMARLKRNFSINVFRMVVGGTIVIGIASVLVGGLVVGSEIAEGFGREETLTGRTDIWAKLLPLAMKEPIIGYGLDGFFTEEMQRSLGKVPHAHNGYLDLTLDYGLVGLVLVSMFFLSSCGKACKSMNNDQLWGSFWICFLIMTLLHNIAEPSIDTFTSHQMAVVLLLSVSSKKMNGKY